MTANLGGRSATSFIVGSEIVVNTSTDGDQWQSDVGNVGGGQVVIAWQDINLDTYQTAGYARFLDENGEFTSAPFEYGTNASQVWDPEVVPGYYGDFYISWTSGAADRGGSAEWYWYDGDLLSPMFTFSLDEGAPDLNLIRSIDVLPNGLLINSWQTLSHYANTNTVVDSEAGLRVYDASTQTPITDEIGLGKEGDVTVWESQPTIVEASGGGFLAVWHETYAGTSAAGVYGQFFDANGEKSGGFFSIGGGGVGSDVALLADGTYVAVWNTWDNGYGREVYGQQFDADGNKIGSRFQVNTTTSGDQFAPEVAALDAGGFVVTWSSESVDGDGYAVMARFYTTEDIGTDPDPDTDPDPGQSNEPDVVGTAAAEKLTSGDAAEHLFGDGGDDTLVGGDGDDTLRGGAGDDQLWAGAGDTGNDLMNGGDGDDIIGGGAGNDMLVGSAGADVAFGGTGDDTLIGGASKNSNETAANQLWSGDGNDLIYGGGGRDALGGGDDDDEIHGGGGNDIIYAGKTGADSLYGDGGNDVIFGGSEDDLIEGGEGADELYGGAGNDNVLGDAGSDTLYGGAGDDTLTGGLGDDTLRPGDGLDLLVFSAGDGADQVDGFTTGDDMLDLSATTTDFTDLASVQAAATDTADGVLIDLGGGDSLFLSGMTQADLTDADFIF